MQLHVLYNYVNITIQKHFQTNSFVTCQGAVIIINAGGGPEDSLGGGDQKCINHLGGGGAAKNIKESRGGTKNNVQ